MSPEGLMRPQLGSVGVSISVVVISWLNPKLDRWHKRFKMAELDNVGYFHRIGWHGTG